MIALGELRSQTRDAVDDWISVNPFAGLSSFGGFLGAFLAFLYFTKKADIPRLAYGFGRVRAVGGIDLRTTGCFTAHDHPGRHTSFFLAVRYPEGARHDLGFYELLFTIAMTAILFAYNRKPRPPGRIIALAALMYAPVRFALDFLRATDVTRPDERYLGLTPAQWACLATAALGLHLWRRREPPPPASPAPSPEPPPESTATTP